MSHHHNVSKAHRSEPNTFIKVEDVNPKLNKTQRQC